MEGLELPDQTPAHQPPLPRQKVLGKGPLLEYHSQCPWIHPGWKLSPGGHRDSKSLAPAR